MSHHLLRTSTEAGHSDTEGGHCDTEGGPSNLYQHIYVCVVNHLVFTGSYPIVNAHLPLEMCVGTFLVVLGERKHH